MKNQCEECGYWFTEPISRDCFDLCDKCYDEMQERLKHLSDRNNRMELARAAVCYANAVDTKKAKLSAFFACVMPEYPAQKVKQFIKAATNE